MSRFTETPRQLLDEIKRLSKDRNAIIEECARVAEENSPAELYPYNPGACIAAAIRALKDKP